MGFTTVRLPAHGATYLTLRASGPVHARSLALSRRLWLAILVLLPLVSLATWHVGSELSAALAARTIALFWWPLAFVLAPGYFAVMLRMQGGRTGYAADASASH